MDKAVSHLSCHCAAAYIVTAAGIQNICERFFDGSRLIFPCHKDEIKSNVGLVADRFVYQAAANERSDTLKKHLRRELELGAAKVHAKMGELLVGTISARQPEDAEAWPIIQDDRCRTELLKFYISRRMGWKETSVNEMTGKDGKPLSAGRVVLYLPDNNRDPELTKRKMSRNV